MSEEEKIPVVDETPVIEEEEITLKADFSAMLWGDLDLLDAMQAGRSRDFTVMELKAFLNRVIVGGVNHLPIADFPKIAGALTAMTVKEISGHNQGN